MALQNDRTIETLIQMTSTGLSIADYPTVKKAIIEKYKEIYGNDIDVTNTTADGIFVENLSLMIFNILENVKFLYSNLDIRTASGTYLENLCALTGVYRNLATNSHAQLEITNNGNTPIIIDSKNNLDFIDQSGTKWSTNVDPLESITLDVGESTLIDVYCNNIGPIPAPKGWINTLLTDGYSLSVNQIEDAVKGSYKETDSELRSRRNEIISSQGLTVLSGLRGALYNITGIEDVYIYNNIDESTALDTTELKAHSIYVVLRKKDNVQISNSKIGSIIYEKLTPGINTCKSTSSDEGKSYEYILDEVNNISADVHWKEAKGINEGLSIEISYKPGNYFATNENVTLNIMRDAIKEYLNNLSINESFTNIDLISLLEDEDPLFNNKKTYNILDVKISGSTNINSATEENVTTYQSQDTYFNINKFSDAIKDDSSTIKKVTFTVSK